MSAKQNLTNEMIGRLVSTEEVGMLRKPADIENKYNPYTVEEFEMVHSVNNPKIEKDSKMSWATTTVEYKPVEFDYIDQVNRKMAKQGK